ncbi:MAG: hypothetical protein HQL26_02355 [Candidatus Omnitrophica bacterium]|nr:hypothetical protein [Candidatus Omnitrophota bacterium]
MANLIAPRKVLFNVNKYQQILFYPTILVFMIGCMMAWLCLMYFMLTDYLANPGLGQIHRLIPYMLVILAAALILVIIWQSKLSNRVVGAFGRVVREMDEVIEGKRPGPIMVRERDEMFYEIVKRVNLLIDKKK